MIWLVIAVVIFFITNTLFEIRTAASLFLAFFISSFLVFLMWRSIFGEIVVMFSIVVGMIYAFFRAIRDKRDDLHAVKSDPNV